MLKFLLLFTTLALVHGNAILKGARAGYMNKYYAYSIDQPTTAVPINILPPSESPDAVVDPGFNMLDREYDTMVIVHGHEGDATPESSIFIKMGLFNGMINQEIEKYNVILVDWSTFTRQSYSVAVNAAPSCGHFLGEFLEELVDSDKINPATLHLVGFGIGAHVVGIAGRRMAALPGGSPRRITGLDPTGKSWGSGTQRLRATDATYVEVIHTDGSGLLANGIGTAIGDVDFFVNGGSNQPGCLTHQCSHNRAYEVFADSLRRNEKLKGNFCTSSLQISTNKCKGFEGHMGGISNVKLLPNGSYRVNTNRSAPY